MSFSASVTELVQNSPSPLVDAAPSWVRADLGDVAAILNGYPWKSAYFNDQLGQPVIRIRDVTSGTTETKYRGEVVDGYWIEDGDLLVGMDGDFNVRVWDGGRALLNQRVCRITPDKRLYLPELLAHVLPGYLQLIHDETHSITVKHLSSKTLAEIPLPLPPLPEQRRIVAKIDSLTGKSRRARDHLDHIPRLVEKYKQAVLAAGFGGKLSNLSRHELPPVALGELIEAGPQNGLYLPKDKYGRGVPILRIQNYGLSSVDEIDTWSRVDVSAATADQYGLNPGDLVINRVNSPSHLGKSMVVAPEMSGALFESNMMRLRLRGQIEPAFIQLYLSSPEGRAGLTKDAKWAVNQASINQGDVARATIPLPTFDAQLDIVRRISTAFTWIDRLASEATSARRLIDLLDQAVLAKAFRGELVPQDPADEPASVLLGRIRAERGAELNKKRRRGGR